MQTAQRNRGLHIKSSCALHRELFLNITIMSRNLLHLPTSVNSHQDTVSHILVVHQWQVCLMHNLIRVWFSNSFLLSSSQCEAYSRHWYKHQYCCIVDYILQILFSSYHIFLSSNQSIVTKIRSISISSLCRFHLNPLEYMKSQFQFVEFLLAHKA